MEYFVEALVYEKYNLINFGVTSPQRSIHLQQLNKLRLATKTSKKEKGNKDPNLRKGGNPRSIESSNPKVGKSK